jgi:hypothetical protein
MTDVQKLAKHIIALYDNSAMEESSEERAKRMAELAVLAGCNCYAPRHGGRHWRDCPINDA